MVAGEPRSAKGGSGVGALSLRRCIKCRCQKDSSIVQQCHQNNSLAPQNNAGKRKQSSQVWGHAPQYQGGEVGLFCAVPCQ